MSEQNPNNCETCEHKQRARHQDGWCYMFRDAPNYVCMQHTARHTRITDIWIDEAQDWFDAVREAKNEG